MRFATTVFYSRCPNAEEYRCFFPFVNHVEECPTCIKGVNERRAVCPTGFHLGKKVLVHVYEECGEIYSTYNRDINNEIVRLELDDTITDVRRIAQMLDVKVMYNNSYMLSRFHRVENLSRALKSSIHLIPGSKYAIPQNQMAAHTPENPLPRHICLTQVPFKIFDAHIYSL